jgi:hypothetical protein
MRVRGGNGGRRSVADFSLELRQWRYAAQASYERFKC